MKGLAFFFLGSLIIVGVLFFQRTITTAIAGFILECLAFLVLILRLTLSPTKTQNIGPNFAPGPAFEPNNELLLQD